MQTAVQLAEHGSFVREVRADPARVRIIAELFEQMNFADGHMKLSSNRVWRVYRVFRVQLLFVSFSCG
ncbi:MAG: hypothetical protein DMF63_03135 [Acidobacteria bacterium]|nr:MAG: hypothetical protein DMF63_03135 [Acidobacteriota bacterium]